MQIAMTPSKAKRKRSSWPWPILRIASILIAGLLLVWFVAMEIVYQVQVGEIASRIVAPRRNLPQPFSQVAWVALGETGKIEQTPSFLGWLPMAFFGPLVFHSKHLSFGDGFQASYYAQRVCSSQQGNAHWKRLLATIWITRHWSAEMAISGAMDSVYYGCSARSLEDAASLYFAKSLDSLNISECVALMTMRQRPYPFPLKRSDKFWKEYNRLFDQVVANWPQFQSARRTLPHFAIDSCPPLRDDAFPQVKTVVEGLPVQIEALRI